MPLTRSPSQPGFSLFGNDIVTLLLLGREIPSFFILEIRLVLGTPNRVAAPWGPPITQSVSLRVARISYRVLLLSVADVELGIVDFCGHLGVRSSTGRGLGSTPSSDWITALSTKF
jgi:hypothetical protein